MIFQDLDKERLQNSNVMNLQKCTFMSTKKNSYKNNNNN